MRKTIKGALAALLTGLGLLACATESNDPTRLEIKSPQDLSLAVGDTSDLWVVSKTSVDGNGRTNTVAYSDFSLESSDPGVAKVIRKQQIVGVKAGTAKVFASDDNINLESDSVTVTVTEP